jgi:hypothetical protein
VALESLFFLFAIPADSTLMMRSTRALTSIASIVARFDGVLRDRLKLKITAAAIAAVRAIAAMATHHAKRISRFIRGHPLIWQRWPDFVRSPCLAWNMCEVSRFGAG